MAAHRKPSVWSAGIPEYLVIVLIALMSIGIVVGGFHNYSSTGHVDGGHAAVAIEEDSPAWDCRTMGNGICGFGAHTFPDGSSFDVTAPAYEYMSDGGFRVDCGPYSALVSIDGSESLESLSCQPL